MYTQTHSTKSTQSPAARPRAQQRCEAPPLHQPTPAQPADVHVELWGILLNHHERLAAPPGLSFVLWRLHSRWCSALYEKMSKSSLAKSEAETDIFVFPVGALTRLWVNTKLFFNKARSNFLSYEERGPILPASFGSSDFLFGRCVVLQAITRETLSQLFWVAGFQLLSVQSLAVSKFWDWVLSFNHKDRKMLWIWSL